MLLAVFLPADGIQGAGADAQGVFLGQEAHVLVYEYQVQQGILHGLHLGGIDGGRVFLQELVGGFHRCAFHSLFIQFGFAAGLGAQRRRVHKEQSQSDCGDDFSDFHSLQS